MTTIQKFHIVLITAIVFIFAILISASAAPEQWNTLDSTHFVIHYGGNDNHAILVQRISEQFYTQVTARLGAIDGKIDLWILSPRQFRSPTAAPIQDWAVGYAYPLKQRIVIKNPSIIENQNLELTRVVKHEIVHVILGGRVGKQIKEIPLWFNEGLAMYESDEWSYGRGWLMLGAVLRKSLIPLDQLVSSFPTKKHHAQLTYAESFSAVSMIARDYGDEKLREIIDFVAQGENMDSAFVLAIGMNLAQFQSRWMQYLNQHYKWPFILSSSMLLWSAITAILVLAYLRRRQTKRMKFAQWEREEQQQDEFFR